MYKPLQRVNYLQKQIHLVKRYFLSDSYKLNESWKARLSTPILQEIQQENMYFDLGTKFQQRNQVSALDIDIYANVITDDSHIDEIADVMSKFRLTCETTDTLESTHHAICRNYIEHNQIAPLILVLKNRLTYGVFLDDFTANLVLNNLVKSKDFKSASRIATLLMLQEDFTNPITKSLSLYACYRYAKTGKLERFDDIVPEVVAEPVVAQKSGKKKKVEEVRVRVGFLRNPYFDDHFDLDDTNLLVGKTLLLLGMEAGDNQIGNSSKLLGYTLYQKFEEGNKLIASLKGKEISKDVINLSKGFLEQIENKEEESFKSFSAAVDNLEETCKLNTDDFEKILFDFAEANVAEHEQKQIEAQKNIYSKWTKLRQQILEDELARLQRSQRLQDIESLAKGMHDEERKLWFFDNEDKIEMEKDNLPIFYGMKYLGKKKKPRTIDTGYTPPEIRKRD